MLTSGLPVGDGAALITWNATDSFSSFVKTPSAAGSISVVPMA